MNLLLLHPLFAVGLIVRILLLVGTAPFPVNEWYLPFLDVTTNSFVLDPWHSWVNEGGSLIAFPYGYVMWLVFLPFTLINKLLGLPLIMGYGATILLVDVGVLLLLNRLLQRRERLILVAYWLSPVVVLATYGYGLNDLVPVLLLLLAIYCLKHVKLRAAGFLSVAAISAKLSMVIALPLVLIYLYNNKALRQKISEFIKGFSVAVLIFIIPFVLSGPGLEMLFGNPEMGKIYKLVIKLGEEVSVYLIPMVYTIVLYFIWRVRRMNFDLMQSSVGLVLLMIVLMTPASPGWFIWCIPFLVFYQANSGNRSIFLVWIFSTFYVASTLFLNPLLFKNQFVFDLDALMHINAGVAVHVGSIMHTVMVAIGVLLVIRMFRESFNRNDFFRLSRKPFAIGIAGDIGSGKDAYADSLSGLFGAHSVVHISGDNYRLWDRQKPIWNVMTRLNPMANDLEGFSKDLLSLIDRKSVIARYYDHLTGKSSRSVVHESNDIILSSGLHALYLPFLRECYDLKVYLDIDERLRYCFSSYHIDEQRGYQKNNVINIIERQAEDSNKFIKPQSVHADLVLSLQPIHPSIGMLEDVTDNRSIRMKLNVTTRHGLNELTLHRVLVGVCGLHVDVTQIKDRNEVSIMIEGEAHAEDIEQAAEMLCPQILEFLDIKPMWKDGILGLMQLVTLSHIGQILSKRIL